MSIDKREFFRNMLPFSAYPYTGERIACPACGGKSHAVARLDRKWKRLTTDMCQDCGLFFTNPMPTEAELSEYYKRMYRSTYGFAFDSVPEDHARKKKKDAENRAGIVVSFAGDGGGRRSLDFGCGLGELVGALERRSFDAHGFEPGDVWSKHTGNPRITHGPWREIDYPEKSFDLITIIHVLEHLRAPLDALRKIESLLKDDGLLWIEVPDMQAYSSKGRKRFHFAHVLGFSHDNLVAAAYRCGFFPVTTISKEQIGKMRNQVSVEFRKRRGGDTLAANLGETARKNYREYTGKALPGA